MKSHLVLVFLVMVGVIGCSHNAPTLVFTFPDGFNGLVLISEDKKSDLVLPTRNGVYNIEIPQNGELAVKDFRPFNHWHKTIARYKSGKLLSDETSTSNTQNALFGLGYEHGRGCYYFVGTKADYDLISKKHDFYKTPLANKLTPSALK